MVSGRNTLRVAAVRTAAERTHRHTDPQRNSHVADATGNKEALDALFFMGARMGTEGRT